LRSQGGDGSLLNFELSALSFLKPKVGFLDMFVG
jgi:hypothetical protein